MLQAVLGRLQIKVRFSNNGPGVRSFFRARLSLAYQSRTALANKMTPNHQRGNRFVHSRTHRNIIALNAYINFDRESGSLNLIMPG